MRHNRRGTRDDKYRKDDGESDEPKERHEVRKMVTVR